MPAPLALPVKKFSPSTGSLNATFILPAPNGCDLSCPGCFIRARQEHNLQELFLTPQDYVSFVRASAADFDLRCVSLQGYEPLLEASRPFTDSILQVSQELGVPTFLVTNATRLTSALGDLARFDLKGLTVSLDSSDPNHHDISRGTVGAFHSTFSALKAAGSHPLLAERTLVASILQPRRHHYLLGMPKLLSEIGLRTWVVTPMLNPKRSGYAFTESAEKLIPTLQELNHLASQEGVELLVDDEFNILPPTGNVLPMRSLQIRRIPALQETIRLTPSGHMSIGIDILSTLNKHGPRWVPASETASAFLRQALRNS